MKPHADFKVVNDTANIVYIEDLDLGNISVTNDAEWVVKEVINRFGPKRIIYKDSEGYWDELLHNGLDFTGFAPLRV
jgi:hypothetical protein